MFNQAIFNQDQNQFFSIQSYQKLLIMKIFKQSSLLLSAILILSTSSCKKGIEFIKNGYDQPNAECLVTHSEDDLFGYSVDIFYNAAGDPDSMSFGGFPVTFKYDARGRLVKTLFGDYVEGADHSYFDYLYKDNTFLPAVLNYYSTLNGGLIVIDSFQYNRFGQMTKIGITNVLRPIFNRAENYEYDKLGNVIKVRMAGENGGTAYDTLFTEYEVLKYDQNANFMAGNQWLKYMFFYTQLDPYIFMMFSRNNAADWLWRPEAYKNYFPDAYFLSSTFDYNNKGFANKVNMRFYDFLGSANYFEVSRLASSTCDAAVKGFQRPIPKNAKFFPKRKDNIPLAIPGR
jgi:hypothetical protein